MTRHHLPPTMADQHRSLFSYNITRPYPYKWFTPVTIVAFCLLTILISYLNYATIAFDPEVVNSADYNGTTGDRSYLHGLPKLLASKNEPTCQPATLPLNGLVFTNHSFFKYEIIGIKREQSSDNDDMALMPALTYSNNVLEDCQIASIQLEASSQDRTTLQMVTQLWGMKVNTYATCRVNTHDGQ